MGHSPIMTQLVNQARRDPMPLKILKKHEKTLKSKDLFSYHDLDFQVVEDFRRISAFFRDRRIDAYVELVKRWR